MANTRLRALTLVYLAVLVACVATLVLRGDFSFGRNPWQNLARTLADFSNPSFFDAWMGPERLEFKADDGRVLRVENRREVERAYLAGIAGATWTTFVIGTLGSALAAVLALPLGLVAARNARAPPWLASPARALLNSLRAIHTLVFGLVLVGIVGLGPMAGILAIAAHSLGTYGKLYAEAIENADAALFESGLALGFTPWQVLGHAMRRGFYPQFASIHLYLWEFNVRDSTVLGLIGAGGLGLLVSEAVSLFQWGRLATLLIVLVALVVAMDRLSALIRNHVLRAPGVKYQA
ncbi:MAG: ABC transporter permease subunit [Pseudomonadota bacterium]